MRNMRLATRYDIVSSLLLYIKLLLDFGSVPLAANAANAYLVVYGCSIYQTTELTEV